MRRAAILLLIIFISYNSVCEAKTTTEKVPQNQPPTIMELAFLRHLGITTIQEIMQQHGDFQLFTFDRIEKITRNIDNDSYDVSLHVIGFEGPLNPPYKLIQMTIRIPGANYSNYRVISYKYRYVSDEEFDKLTKYAAD
ncbi:hypothetical protein ACA30_18470 [Virgibacillus soli]|uniref:Uncharacterized protein n=1 Tax=Lederbergia galactosidilytica TaxID=217031 RepID=A0A0Q9XYC6_9BACI|nr:hypothetical protein [Lederbergia galactosidilytica]KRG12598.1 hypothetical protein ACA30_18470 [Virgibacillus soli]KRG13629.1 hypothetical protein ACA29_08065 [Lederbergia galactosidilytica]MBP1916074.1 hypothetical protein [Lederbergia galactosidilytica]